MLTRRGFLRTLAVATGTLAVFDPKTLLWLPSHPTGPVALASPGDVGLQAELNALAARFAQILGHQLRSSKSVTLEQVWYQHAGTVRLVPFEVLVDGGIGAGRFVPSARVMLPGMPPTVDTSAGVDRLTSWLEGQARELQRRFRNVTMFVPISAEMRPGVPFADATVGVGRDLESGLSARALRWRTDAGETYTGLEVAGGQWQRWLSSTEAYVRATKAARWRDEFDADEADERAAWVEAHRGDYQYEE